MLILFILYVIYPDASKSHRNHTCILLRQSIILWSKISSWDPLQDFQCKCKVLLKFCGLWS